MKGQSFADLGASNAVIGQNNKKATSLQCKLKSEATHAAGLLQHLNPINDKIDVVEKNTQQTNKKNNVFMFADEKKKKEKTHLPTAGACLDEVKRNAALI